MSETALFISENAAAAVGTKKVEIASVLCKDCGLPFPLNADGSCFSCDKFPRELGRARRSSWWERLRRVTVGAERARN